jgi:hypothetical protein
MKKGNKVVTSNNGSLDSNAGAAKMFKPGVYSLKSNPVDVNNNQSQVMDLGLGTSRGGDKYKGTQGK